MGRSVKTKVNAPAAKWFEILITVLVMLAAGCGPTGNFAVDFSPASFTYQGNIPFDNEGSPRVLQPALGAPQFVRPGDELAVVYAMPLAYTSPNGQMTASLARRIKGADGRPVEIEFPLDVTKRTPESTANVNILRLAAPIDEQVPSGCYTLRLQSDSGKIEVPLSVRVFRGDLDSFRFIQLTDIQLQDPRLEKEKLLATMKRADSADVLFALVTGDLVFGGDYYEAEYQQFIDFWTEQANFCSLMLPGNHDLYNQTHKRSAVENMVKKASSVFDLFTSPIRALGELFMGSELKQQVDGLEVYLRRIGPVNYVADFGDMRMVMVNTYSGSPGRRSSIPPTVIQQFIKKLRVPPADNWGGELTAGNLDWLDRTITKAREQEKKLVVAGHHDPRGTRGKNGVYRYIADEEFNTRPFELEPFESWNYDPNLESETENSGVRMIRMMTGNALAYISGHTHYDGADELAVADTGARLPFISTVAAGPRPPEGGQGYRVFTFAEGRLSWTDSITDDSVKITEDPGSKGVVTVDSSLGFDYSFRIDRLVDPGLCTDSDGEGFDSDTEDIDRLQTRLISINDQICLMQTRGVAEAR